MRQAEKERKKILVPSSIHTRPGQENSEKNTKKLQKVKKPLSGIIFSQNEMRQAEKERKKFQSRILFILNPCKKIPKKIARKFKKLKNLFPEFFQPKRDEIGRERENKILVPNSVLSRPGHENYEKTSKKIKKIKKPHSCIIFSQNGLRQAEKEKKKILVLNSVHKIPRKI